VVTERALTFTPSNHTSVILEAPLMVAWNSSACQPLLTLVELVIVVAATSLRKLSLPVVETNKYPRDTSAEVR